MRTITLTNGDSCLVDDEDYDFLIKFGWYISKNGYARTCLRGKRFVLMHRMLLGARPGDTVDHINRNTLDNRRSNLRLADKRVNTLNRGLRKDNTSGVKGVRVNDSGTFTPYTYFNRRQLSWGTYQTLDEAVAVRIREMKKLHPDMPEEYFR